MPDPRKPGMVALRDMPNTMFAVYPAGHDKAGQVVEREKTCGCGRVFTQSLISARELEAAARLNVLDRMVRQIPDGYVPVHCPSCERRELTYQARVADAQGTASRTLPDRRGAA